MTTEELLKQRYEIISPYPFMPTNKYKVGDLLQRSSNNLFYIGQDDDTGVWYQEICEEEPIYGLSAYPSIFRKLQWWEKREASDMPEYVKATEWAYINGYKIEIGDILKVTYWEDNSAKTEYGTLFAQRLLPATLAEYTSYTASKK